MSDARISVADVDGTRAGGDVKRFATICARAALLGVACHCIQNDDGAPVYVLSWRALTRSFDDLAAVESWLTRFEGGKR